MKLRKKQKSVSTWLLFCLPQHAISTAYHMCRFFVALAVICTSFIVENLPLNFFFPAVKLQVPSSFTAWHSGRGTYFSCLYVQCLSSGHYKAFNHRWGLQRSPTGKSKTVAFSLFVSMPTSLTMPHQSTCQFHATSCPHMWTTAWNTWTSLLGKSLWFLAEHCTMVRRSSKVRGILRLRTVKGQVFDNMWTLSL